MFPYSRFKKLSKTQKAALFDIYSSFLTEERIERLQSVLDKRTRYLTVVAEDLYDSQNSSALIRHCEAYGIQDYHVIENSHELSIKKHVVRGTAKWIELHRYRESKNNTAATLKTLKGKGYRILGADPDPSGIPLDRWQPEEGATAFLFGNECTGLSDSAREMVDGFLHIPMFGFVESLNISASCAILLYQVRKKLELSTVNFSLPQEEREAVLLEWYDKSIKGKKRLKLKLDIENFLAGE